MIAGIRSELVLYGIGAGMLLLLVNRMSGGKIVTGAAEVAASAPVDAFIGASAGLFGLPDTRTATAKTACEKALEAGDDWEASFQCGAWTWGKGLFDGK